MSEKSWTPKIVQNETLEDIVTSIKNVIDKAATEFGANLHIATSTLTLNDETRIRTKFYLKDKSGSVTKKQPSLLILSEIAAQINDEISDRSIDRAKYEINSESNTDSDNNLYTDFIIRRR